MRDRVNDFRTTSLRVPPAVRVGRRGFSFPEVLFAVIVLGIGFIMVAAIFPVALQQSKMTQDETSGAAVAKAAVGQLQQLASDPRTAPPFTAAPPIIMPATGDTITTDPAIVSPILIWSQISGSLIFADDPRYAFVPVYRRSGNSAVPPPAQNNWSGTAQIYVIAVECRGAARPVNAVANVPARVLPVFDIYDVCLNPAPPLNQPFSNVNNLAPHQVFVKATDNYNGGRADVIEVNKVPNLATTTAQNLPDAVAEGAYVIIRNSGRIYRVGLRREDLDANDPQYNFYELQPGNDIQDATAENLSSDTAAIVVGRERLADGSFTGGAQDVSIYTTTIPVKP